MASPKSCKFFTNQFRKDYFLCTAENPSKLGTAECGSGQILYIIYRLLWTIWWIGVFIHDVIDEPNRHLFLTFLTNWSYMVVGLSSILQFVASVYGAVNAKRLASSTSTPLLYRINWVIYSFASASAIMVSLLYWFFIFDGEDLIFTNYATHAVNSAYVILDIFITGVPFRLLHFWLPEIFGIVYTIFSVIYWTVSGNIIYDTLDYEDDVESAIIYIAIALVATPVIHSLLFFLYWLRVLIYDCCSCCKSDEEHLRNLQNPNFEPDSKYVTRIEMA